MKTPFIPEDRVRLIAIDSRYVDSPIASAIKKLGIKLFPVYPCQDTYQSINCHPDIQFHPLDEKNIIVAPNAHPRNIQGLKDLKFNIIVGKTPVGAAYPQNICYNVGRIGRYAFHDFRYTDPILIMELKKRQIKLIQVKQGYTKCSMAILNHNTFVTQDRGIYRAAISNGLEALLMSPGGIELPGHPYGFIGGATGLIGENELAITGSLKNHPDVTFLENFVNNHNIKLLALTNNPCIDIGSLIYLK